MTKILDIKDVPKSPNTGFESQSIYNPMDEDFIGYWDSEAYTIPAGKSKDFPEFLAYHLAKHLSKFIVKNKWEIKIREEARGQITPDTAKAVPTESLQLMMTALLTGKKETFDALREMPKPNKEAPAIEDKTQDSDILAEKEKKAEELREERIKNMDKAREAKAKKVAERKVAKEEAEKIKKAVEVKEEVPADKESEEK